MSEDLPDNTEQSDGGYEYNFVDRVPDRLICTICHLPSCDAQLSECCGYIYCKSCVKKWENTTDLSFSCPTCRAEKLKTFVHHEANRTIKELEISCPNLGCNWQGTLGEVNSHFKEACEMSVQSKHRELQVVNKHENWLISKTIKGFYIKCWHTICCKHSVTEYVVLILCITIAFFTGIIVNIQTTVCYSSAVNKTFEGASNISGSVSFLSWFLVQFDKLILAPLSSDYMKPVTLKIENFTEKIKSNVTWHSKPFLTYEEGYQICMRVDAAGSGDGNGTHVSLKFHLMKGPHDDKLQLSGRFPVDGGFNVELIDQSGNENHYTDYISMEIYECYECAQRVLDDEMGKGVVYDQFISHDAILDQNFSYLVNDTAHFRVSYADTNWLFIFVLILTFAVGFCLVLGLISIGCVVYWRGLSHDETNLAAMFLLLLLLLGVIVSIVYFVVFTIGSVVLWELLTFLFVALALYIHLGICKKELEELNLIIKTLCVMFISGSIIALVIVKITLPTPLAWPWI